MDAPCGAALLRSPVVGALVVAGLVVGHLMAMAAALAAAEWFAKPGLFYGSVSAFAAACTVAWVVGTGHWARGRGRVVQYAAVLALGGCYLAVAAVALAWGIDELGTRREYATPASHSAPGLVSAALALLAIAILAVALPVRTRRRRVAAAVLGAALLGAGALLGTAGAAAVIDPCESFRFDRDRWRAELGVNDAERLARALARCGTLDGASKARVRRMLGAPDRSGPFTWRWFVYSASPSRELAVTFGRDGRVRDASVG